MFTVKATYRQETRKLSFPDSNSFPSFQQLCNQLYRVFPISHNYYLSRLLFSPDSSKPSRILIAKEVHNAVEYDACLAQYQGRIWSNAMLKLSIFDETPHKATAAPIRETSLSWNPPIGSRDVSSSNSTQEWIPGFVPSWGVSPGVNSINTQPPLPPPQPPVSFFNIPPPPIIYSPCPPMDVDTAKEDDSSVTMSPFLHRPKAQQSATPCCDVSKCKAEVQSLLASFKEELDGIITKTFGAPAPTKPAEPQNMSPPPLPERLPQQVTNQWSPTSSHIYKLPCLINRCSSCATLFEGPWYYCSTCKTSLCPSCHGNVFTQCVRRNHPLKREACFGCPKDVSTVNPFSSSSFPARPSVPYSYNSNNAPSWITPVVPFIPPVLPPSPPLLSHNPFGCANGLNTNEGNHLPPATWPYSPPWLPPVSQPASQPAVHPWTPNPRPYVPDQPEQSSAPPPFIPPSPSPAPQVVPIKVHNGVACDMCDKTVEGVRHKCLDCPDYDLCDSCVRAGAMERHNPFHEFLDIEEPGRVVVHTVYSGDGERDVPIAHNATCDLCDSRIIGDRYKCLNCPDFDTCASCFNIVPDQHPKHSFVRVKKADDYIVGQKNTSKHFATCNVCTKGIFGIRYKCMHPECPDFDLCETCEALPIAVHPAMHPMLKMKTPDTVVPTVYRVGQTTLIDVNESQDAPRGRPRSREHSVRSPSLRFGTSRRSPSLEPAVIRVPSQRIDIPTKRSGSPRVMGYIKTYLAESRSRSRSPRRSWSPPILRTRRSPHRRSRSPRSHSRSRSPRPTTIPTVAPTRIIFPPWSIHSTSPVICRSRSPQSRSRSRSPRTRLPPLMIPFTSPQTVILPPPTPSSTSSSEIRTWPQPKFPHGYAPATSLVPAVSGPQLSVLPWNREWSSTSRSSSPEWQPQIIAPPAPAGPAIVVSGFAVTQPRALVQPEQDTQGSSMASSAKFKLPPLALDPSSDLFREFWPRVAQELKNQQELKSQSDSAPESQAVPSEGPAPVIANTFSESPLTGEEALLNRPDDAEDKVEMTQSNTAPVSSRNVRTLAALLHGSGFSSPLGSTPVGSSVGDGDSVATTAFHSGKTYGADCVSDVTVPDGQVFPPGAEFVKSWRIFNSGTKDWPETTRLVFVAGETFNRDKNALQKVNVGTLPAGSGTDVWTNELKAPEVAGRYVGYWRFDDGFGNLFGDSIWVDITVAEVNYGMSSEDESLAASSIIMPRSAPAQSVASSVVVTGPDPDATLTVLSPGEDTVSDGGSDGSSVSLISVPSSDDEDDEDAAVWQDSRSHVSVRESVGGSSGRAGMEYVMLYDEASSEDDV